jgi:hypothetical protein
LRETEIGHEPAISRSLVEGIQVCALKILDESESE